MLTDEPQAIEDALLVQQAQVHFSNLLWTIGGSLSVAAFFAAIEWSVLPAAALLAWLVALVVVLGARLVTGGFYRRIGPGLGDQRRWLMAYRLGSLAHGVVWGLATLLPLPPGDAVHQSVRIVLLVGLSISSFAMTAFDLVAALAFGIPVIVLLGLSVVLSPEPAYRLLGAVGLVALVFFGMTARRVNRAVRRYVALRVGEAAQAEALRSSEELLERTGATAGVGGWELEPATKALRLTAQAYRIHDVDPVARPTFDGFVALYAPEQQAWIREGLDDAVARGIPFDRVMPLRTWRGQRRWVRLIGRPQLGAGVVKRINGVVQDVTQTRVAELALAEQHHLLNLLVRTTREGFWFVDTDAVTTDVNPAMCTILGRPREALIGQSVFAFVDAANAMILRRADGVASGYEIELTLPDGSQLACFNNATPIFDTSGQRVGSIGMWTDISERKRAQEQLRATSEQLAQKTQALQVTLDSIAQGIVSLDARGRTSVFNRRAAELLALPESLLAGQATFEQVLRFQIERGELAEDGSFIDADGQRRCLRDPKSLPDVYVRRSHSGALVEVRNRHLPDGAVVRTFTDVTAYIDAQHALRDRQAELRALLDAFPGFIAVLDSRYTYRYVNDRFAGLFGSSREALIGRSAREVLGDARFERLRRHLDRARIEGSVTVESEYEATVFRPHTFMQVTHAIGVDDGTGRNFYAFGIDIGARKTAELEVIAARDEAERANQAKSQFLSSMSHELRTPMNAILGFGQLLVSDPQNPLPERQREHVREILRGARHLLSLINEVLDLALVETGKLRISLEPVHVAQLVEECLGLLQPLAHQSGIDVAVADALACDCHVAADRTRLRQVLLNLLSNAIKYNRPGGRVRVACAADGDAVRIDVSDSGQGLGAEQRERLFQAFERLDAAQSEVEGAGLGLALSQRLVHAMHGQIGLESEVGQGSTFWVRLPRAGPPHIAAGDSLPSARASGAGRSEARPRKVLYIEDNPVNVLLMEAMLARIANLQMVSAPLPAMGLQMATDEQPDLILLDIQLPGMDGYEVLRRLRLDEASRAIPVIAVSANAMASDVERGLGAGFVDYLTKPLDMHRLIAAVDAALAPR